MLFASEKARVREQWQVPSASGCLPVSSSVSTWVPQTSQATGPLDKINHFIVIYQENWSFGSLYGNFPGASGIVNAIYSAKQVSKAGDR